MSSQATMDFDQPSPTDTLSPPGSPAATHGHHEPQPGAPGTNTGTPGVTHHPGGATVYAPTATPSAELNPRSCVTCRRRKVRCDKSMPCSNCRRAQIPCIFPAPERAPRRPRRKDPAALSKQQQQSSEREVELMKRLRKLEGIVEDLSGQVEQETNRNRSESADSPGASGGGSKASEVLSAHGFGESGSGSGGSQGVHISPATSQTGISPAEQGQSGPKGKAQGQDVSSKFGRLMLGERGKTRYVSSAFWSKLNDELDDLRAETQKLSASSDESEPEGSPGSDPHDSPQEADHHSFIMGYRSCDLDLRGLHPQPAQAAYLWEQFVENVDPLVKILHKPTVAKMVWDAQASLNHLPPATEALLFSIYFSTVTSLEDEDTEQEFGVKKLALLGQYRFALEQSLAKAEFLTTSDMTVLQALVIFLVAARRHDDTRFCWTMTSLAIRLAESMGLHRDGSKFPNLSLFECEMRRRLWHTLTLLDLRSAEEQGTDIIILERAHDTKYPINCNDEDMTPDMTVLPPVRTGPSDMTVSMVRFEVLELSRRIYSSTSARGSNCPNSLTPKSLEERENLIQETWRRVQRTYLSDPAMEGIPRYWVIGNIGRIIISKMTLLLYQHVLFPGPTGESLPLNLRDRLFATATEIFEYGVILNTDVRTKRWRWLFKTYTQWHAVAYLLVEVYSRPWAASVERAWSALTFILADEHSEAWHRLTANAEVWVPFKKLVARAKKHRKVELERLIANPAEAAKMDDEDQARFPPLSFDVMSLSLKGIATRERWRKLVGLPPLPPPTWKKTTGAQQAIPHVTSVPFTSSVPAPQTQPQDYEKSLNNTIDDIFAGEPRFFSPVDLFPVAFNPDMLNAFAPSASAAMGFGGPDIGMVGRTNSNPVLADGLPNMTAAPPQQRAATVGGVGMPLSDTPLVDARRKDLPPWSFPISEGGGGLDGGVGGLFQSPQLSDNSGLEDIDVNMDENFDWQGFGENLKGLSTFDMNMGQGGSWNPGPM